MGVVLVAHGEPLLRAGMRAALESARLQVLDAATLAAVDEQASAADALVIDADLGGPGAALPVCARLAAHGQARVIVVLSRGREADIGAVARAGVAGILTSQATAAQFVAAVLDALAGGSPVSPELAGLLLGAARRAAEGESGAALTARELQVLSLAAEGRSNRQIGDRLFLSENTVKNHLRRINEKLGVNTRTEAVTRAVRDGLISIS